MDEQDGASATSVESRSKKVPRQITDAGDAFVHKIWIEHLDPGQVYPYRIVGTGYASGIHRFRTVPSSTDKITFIVYGDSRSHPEQHRQLVEQMIDIQSDFAIHTGDLVTSGGSYE